MVHGDASRRRAAAMGLDPDGILDLAMSLNPVAPDVTPLVRDAASHVRHYPDSDAPCAALAHALGVDAGRVVLTNGGAEAIALVAAAMPEGWVEDPDFSLYRRHLRTVAPGAPRWRSNPHNPTGRLAPVVERAAVWDEAFYPASAGRWSRGAHEPGAFVIGSLTKLFACPGLRIGYVIAPDEGTAGALLARRPAWNVNAIAAALLPGLVEHVDLTGWRDRIAVLRGELAGVLAGVGVAVEPSDACYVLAADGGWLREPLESQGIFTRDCTSFGMPGALRIAVPDEAGLERLAGALARISRPAQAPDA